MTNNSISLIISIPPSNTVLGEPDLIDLLDWHNDQSSFISPRNLVQQKLLACSPSILLKSYLSHQYEGRISTSTLTTICYRSEVTPNEQALKLLSVIQDRGSQAFNDFISVLLESDRHKHLGELLQGHHGHVSPIGTYVSCMYTY